jgi:SAM-dependent methyltransferase
MPPADDDQRVGSRSVPDNFAVMLSAAEVGGSLFQTGDPELKLKMNICAERIAQFRLELEKLWQEDAELYRALFVDGRPVVLDVAPPALRTLLAQLDIAVMSTSGTRQLVRSAVRVFPIADCWIATDHVWYRGDDTVMPMCPENELLLREIVVRPNQTVLDIGIGSGVLAIAAQLRGAEHVTGLEVNHRAKPYVRFNIALNDLHEADFTVLMNSSARVEDVFNPVSGRKFDVIVANPPFEYGRALSLDANMVCGASGPDGLAMIRFVLERVADFLVEDGCFHMVFFSAGTAYGPTELLRAAEPLPGRTSVKYAANSLFTKYFVKESVGLDLDIPPEHERMWFGVLNFERRRGERELRVEQIESVPGWHLALYSPVNVGMRAPGCDAVYEGRERKAW